MTAAVEGTALTRPEVRSRAARQQGKALRAPFALRCGAILIDYIFLVSIIAMTTLMARMAGSGSRGASTETLGMIALFAALVGNLGVLPGFTGRTIGKWATGLRIERADGGEIGIGRALIRHLIGYPLSLLPLGLGFMLAAVTTRGRALHDFVTGTVVVREAT
jgi:uncharacterized RDD family membrane protein YckC